jgi:hypothetical protein
MDGTLPSSIQWRSTKGTMHPNLRRNLATFDGAFLEESLRSYSDYLSNFYDIDALSVSLERYLRNPVREGNEDVLIALFSAAVLGTWWNAFENTKRLGHNL